MPLAAGHRLGPYEIVSPLGAGGMGEVYRARDIRLDRAVALKVLPEGLTTNADARARFDREARAIAAVNHPNICVIHDVGHDDHLDFIVMELLEGETLAAVLRRGPLPVDRVIEYGLALADGLEAAHRRGLIHRDLKPANVFVTSRGTPKILDFGLAKTSTGSDATTRVADEPLTGRGAAIGTLAYMSPEQLRGEPLDARTDVFSLGLVLYEMATGQRAFNGPSGVAVAAAILTNAAIDPKRARPELPSALSDVILKCLEKDRELRTQSAADLRASLARLRRGSSATAAPSALSRAPGSRAWMAAGIAVALMAAGGYAAKQMWLSKPSAPPPAVTTPPPLSTVPAQTQSSMASSDAGKIAPPASAPASLPASPATSAPAPPPIVPKILAPPEFDVAPISTAGTMAAISPDGKVVVFRKADASGQSVWAHSIASGEEFRVVAPAVDRRIFGLTVTPDGAGVGLMAKSLSAAVLGPSELLRAPLLGGTLTKVLSNLQSLAGWSRDGTQLAFVGTDPGWATLVVSAADGQSTRVLSRRKLPAMYNMLNSSAPLNRPAWSPDGKSIALVGIAKGQNIGLVDVATGAEQILAWPEVPLIDAVAWFDNDRLLLTRTTPETTNHQVWTLNVRTREFAPVTHDASAYSGLSIANDGTALVSTRTFTPGGVWLGDKNGQNMRQVLPDGAIAPTSLSVSNSGRVVYSIGASIWTMDTPASIPRLVVKSGLGPALMPDGETIVYSDVLRDSLYRIRCDGSSLAKIVDGDARDAALSPDGKMVFFASFRSGVWTIWSVPLEGGAPRLVLTGEGGMAPQISPDGTRLLYYTGGPPKICTLPECGDRQQFPAGSKWSPDGRLAYANQSNLWLRPAGAGAPQALTSFPDKAVSSFAWSPDGKRLVVARSTTTSEIVLLKLKAR